jgi:hypothetical protein
MFRKIPAKKAAYTITRKEGALYYALTNPTAIKGVEVSDDLYSIKFYCAVDDIPINEKPEKQQDLDWKVRVYIEQQFAHYNISTPKYIEITQLDDYSMKSLSFYGTYDEIKKYFGVKNELHQIEKVLTEARNKGLLPTSLYERIRIDVRHRAEQLREVTRANKIAYEETLLEIKQHYQPDANFKRIAQVTDAHEFGGQLVAYICDHPTSNTADYLFPVKTADRDIHFAYLSDCCCWGHALSPFSKFKKMGSNPMLDNEQVAKDPILAMRLATLEELQFLRAAVELDQCRHSYMNKLSDIKKLDSFITRAELRPEMTDTISTKPIFTVRKAAVIPPFESYHEGVVDWLPKPDVKQTDEHQEKRCCFGFTI